MNKYIALFISLMLCFIPSMAQSGIGFSPEIAVSSDPSAEGADSLTVEESIFDVLPVGVIINQSHAMKAAFDGQIVENAGKKYNGFRVRIYLSSAQNARDASARAYNVFTRLYPDVPAYRVYDSPNFRVTVGNFRTRLEADNFARAIKSHFPTASVMRERFKYPTIGRTDLTARDTTAVDMMIMKEE